MSCRTCLGPVRGPHQCADRQTAACAGSQHHRSITRCETALNLLSLSGMLDVDNYFNSEFAEHSRVVAATRDQLGDPFQTSRRGVCQGCTWRW